MISNKEDDDDSLSKGSHLSSDDTDTNSDDELYTEDDAAAEISDDDDEPLAFLSINQTADSDGEEDYERNPNSEDTINSFILDEEQATIIKDADYLPQKKSHEMEMQWFQNEKKYIEEVHPEIVIHSDDEVRALSVAIRDKQGNIIDELHKTMPILSKYEMAKLIGIRSQHLDEGAIPYVDVAELNSMDIAELELRQKLLPYMIRRPIPGGRFEYWSLIDLEIL